MEKCIMIGRTGTSLLWKGCNNMKFHTTPAACVDQNWRKANKLGPNPTSEGVLVHAPDYTFMDGRETPISAGQLGRLKDQRKYASQIVTMIAEVDFAVKRQERMQKEKVAEKQKLMSQKLIPKGHLILKK